LTSTGLLGNRPIMADAATLKTTSAARLIATWPASP
jgi:hypothetical protein